MNYLIDTLAIIMDKVYSAESSANFKSEAMRRGAKCVYAPTSDESQTYKSHVFAGRELVLPGVAP